MKKTISRGCAVLLACAMLAGLLTTTAFARASDYLGGYGVWATAKSDGVVRIHADVEAVRTSDEVGVRLYHRAGVQGRGRHLDYFGDLH